MTSADDDAGVGDSAPESVSLEGIPPHVVTCLVAAVTAARDPAPTLDAGDGARAAGAEVIQAARVVQAWAESVEASGTRMVLRGVEEDCGLDLGQREPASTRQARRREARRATATELEVLTGLSSSMCRDRVALASATEARADYLRARMEHGTLDAYRAITLCKETRHLDALTAEKIAREVLRPLDGQASDPHDAGSLTTELAAVAEDVPIAQGTFRRRLKRQLTKAESAAGLNSRKAAERAAARDVRTEDGPYGTATTWIDAMRDRAYAAQHRVDTIARSARQAGDERTLAQLRSDIATDLLIHGTVRGDQVLGSPPAARLNIYVGLATLLPDQADCGADTGEVVRSGADTAAGHTEAPVRSGTDTAVGDGAHDEGVVRSGTDNPAEPVFDTEGLGEVPGLGFLTADQVRRMALAAGSLWRRLVTDPVTGAVIETSQTYRPTQAMRDLVTARDRRCRAPGCTIPAHEADLDHDVPWRPGARTPGEGATHPDNLHALHRGHHHAKTRRWWHSTQGADGAVHWLTLTGQSITTQPPGEQVVHSGTDKPVSGIEATLAQVLDITLDPPAMLDPDLAQIHVTSTTPPWSSE